MTWNDIIITLLLYGIAHELVAIASAYLKERSRLKAQVVADNAERYGGA